MEHAIGGTVSKTPRNDRTLAARKIIHTLIISFTDHSTRYLS